MKAPCASHILSICNDPALAESRELVLRHAGYCVHSTKSDADLTEWSCTPIELVLLCHSIGETSLQELIPRLRRLFPETGIIYVGLSSDPRNLPVDGQCSVEEGPSGLLKCIEALLSQGSVAPVSLHTEEFRHPY